MCMGDVTPKLRAIGQTNVSCVSGRTVAIVLLLLVAIGCKSDPKVPPKPPTKPVLKITHQVGGTHERVIIHKGVWYQVFGSSVQVIDPVTLNARRTVAMGEPGQAGPALDMAIVGEQMFVVVEDDAVVELSLADPLSPRVVATIPAAKLGIAPRRLSVVNDETYACGVGGVVRLSDGKRIYPSPDEVTSVAMGESGLLACANRRVFQVETGQYVGSASVLVNAGEALGRPGVLVFTRVGEEGALVGLMTPQVREVSADAATIGFGDVVRRVRFLDGRLWIVCDSGIHVYEVGEQSLANPKHIDVLGARDVDRLDENHLIIVGSFGRTIYRENATGKGPGSTFEHVEREASRLSRAATDGRHVLAGSHEGAWMYLINARAELTSKPVARDAPPSRAAATVDASARLTDDGSALRVTGANFDWTHKEPNGTRMNTVVSVEGDFWIGHDRGITVLRSTMPKTEEEFEAAEKAASRSGYVKPDPYAVLGRMRLPGSVKFMYPLLVGGGATYVSEFGGFGVISIVDEPIAVQSS